MEFIKSKGTFSSTGVDDESEIEASVGKNIEAYCKVSLKENLDNYCKIFGKKGIINVSSPWLPAKKSFIEIKNGNSYHKKFITSNKTIYATQIETISNLFLGKETKNNYCVDIDQSVKIMKILDQWKKSLI